MLDWQAATLTAGALPESRATSSASACSDPRDPERYGMQEMSSSAEFMRTSLPIVGLLGVRDGGDAPQRGQYGDTHRQPFAVGDDAVGDGLSERGRTSSEKNDRLGLASSPP